MGVFRYGPQEASNIAKARKQAEQEAKVAATVASRKAAARVTKTSLGLDNVDNTSDADKPVSAATQAALAGKATIVAVPPTSTSPGSPGQIASDASYFYVCVATDTWRRAPISTW